MRFHVGLCPPQNDKGVIASEACPPQNDKGVIASEACPPQNDKGVIASEAWQCFEEKCYLCRIFDQNNI